MKKIFSLLFILFVGMTIFSSCEGCSKTTPVDGIEQVDSLDSISVDSLAADTVEIDSIV